MGDIKKAEKAKLSTLIPAFVYIDRKNGSSYITTTYIKVLACTVMGYLTCQKEISLPEMAKYYYYISECIEEVEKYLPKKIDFQPLGDDCKKGVTLIVTLAAETYKTALNGRKDKIITAVEEGLKALDLEEEDEDFSEDDFDDDYADFDEEYEKDTDPDDDSEEYSDFDDEEYYDDTDTDSGFDILESGYSAIEELDNLVGLTEVKKQIRSFINVLQVKKRCDELGIRRDPISMHMVFSGNPGTGKTTVARILGRIYKEKGLLSKGHLVEVSRADLVGKYAGYTAKMVKDVFKEAKGGVLFIDEAYSLVSNEGYGDEAISMIVKLMEDYREDLVVIVSGYPDLMQEFIVSNPGLRSRFPFTVRFPDYTGDELAQIYEIFCRDNEIECPTSVMNEVRAYFDREVAKKNCSAGNGRSARNYFEQMLMNQANRLFGKENIARHDLCSFTLADLPENFLFSYIKMQSQISEVTKRSRAY